MTHSKKCLGTPPNPDCDCGVGLPLAPAPALVVKCSACGGRGRIADAPCAACKDGYLPACLNCASEPRDYRFSPCCSPACAEQWAIKEKRARLELGLTPLITRAP